MLKLLADSNSRLSSDSTTNDLAPRRRLRDLTGLRLLRIIERQNRFKEITKPPCYPRPQRQAIVHQCPIQPDSSKPSWHPRLNTILNILFYAEIYEIMGIRILLGI